MGILPDGACLGLVVRFPPLGPYWGEPQVELRRPARRFFLDILAGLMRVEREEPLFPLLPRLFRFFGFLYRLCG